MGRCGGIDSLMQKRDFASVFDHAKRGDHRLNVLEKDESVGPLQETERTCTGRWFIFRRKIGVNDGTSAADQPRQLIGQTAHFGDAIETSNSGGIRIIRSEFWPGVSLHAWVAGRQEENLRVRAGRRIILGFGRRRDEESFAWV